MRIVIEYILKREKHWRHKLQKSEDVIMKKPLYKIEEGKKVCGVCGGIAEYFGFDPTLVRIAWVLFTALGGSGIIAYIICAIIMPKKSDITPQQ